MTRQRLAWIDMARGTALLAMFAYHIVWDLGFYGLIDPFIPGRPGFKFFGHCIAAAFLMLAGISMVLAWQAANPWPGFWRRLAVLAAAAAAVTGASLWFSPAAPIYFGILHCIAVSSLLALPFLAARLWVMASVTAGALALPLLASSSVLDPAGLSWLGLGAAYPVSEDFRPLFPWAGMLLLGVLAARTWLLLPGPDITKSMRRIAWLAWIGQHSLPIYLLHQPIFIAAISLAASYMQPPMPSLAQDFDNQCKIECMAGGAAAPLCTSACGCLADSLRRDGLWSVVETGRLSGPQQARLEALARECRAKAGGS